jgi:hypothetical protein
LRWALSFHPHPSVQTPQRWKQCGFSSMFHQTEIKQNGFLGKTRGLLPRKS